MIHLIIMHTMIATVYIILYTMIQSMSRYTHAVTDSEHILLHGHGQYIYLHIIYNSQQTSV